MLKAKTFTGERTWSSEYLLAFGLILAAFATLVAVLSGCAQSPLGREQLMLIPQQTVDADGVQAFDQLKQQQPVDPTPANNAFVSCVAGAITRAARGQTGIDQWDVVVFQSKEINAFALPGGKIGVYTGILPVTQTDAQLGAVLGHEVGHVIAQHGRERMSEAVVEQGGLALADAFAKGAVKSGTAQTAIMGALGLGAQVGVALPHSRTQESEADLIGLKLMAQAGFDPRQSVQLWQNMTNAAGNGPPAILSDHPANQSRIDALNAHMPEALQLYQQAQAAGQRPSCRHP